MSLIDDIASAAIDKAQDKMQGEESNERFSGKRLLITIVWVVLACLISLFTFLGAGAAMVGGSSTLFILALVLGIAFAGVTFFVPFLRKKGSMTRWCGIVVLGDLAWILYVLFAS